jgi:hypothetical protein
MKSHTTASQCFDAQIIFKGNAENTEGYNITEQQQSMRHI